MTLKWMDGAEIWESGSYLARTYASSSGVVGTTSQRRIDPGDRSYSLSSGHLRTPSLGVLNIWVVGFGLRISSVNDFSWRFLKAGDEQCRLEKVQVGGAFRLRLMRGATQIAETTETFAENIWHFFELKVTVRPGTDGAYELRHNETTILSGTGVDLADTATDGCDIHSIGHTSGSATYLDDVYICDGAGTSHNDFLGDSVVVGLLPDEDGAASDFTPSSGADHYALVDDPASGPNDAEYVESSTVGHTDLFGLPDLPTSGLGTIHGVQIAVAASLDQIGSRTLRTKFRDSGGTLANGEDFVVSGLTVVETPTIMEVNPVDDSAWTKSAIDGGQFGVEVVS